MIFVTTGTNAGAAPFDRLLRELDGIASRELLVVQHGASQVCPRGASCLDYIAFDRFEQLVQTARAVVTHAGVGSILVCLRHGKQPYVVPRLARLGEHVDDHQLELAERLDSLGVVTLVEDPRELESLLFSSTGSRATGDIERGGNLVEDLGGYLESVLIGAGRSRDRAREASVVA